MHHFFCILQILRKFAFILLSLKLIFNGEMVQRLRGLQVLSKNLMLVASTHVVWLITAFYCISRVSDILFLAWNGRPTHEACTHMAPTHMACTHTEPSPQIKWRQIFKNIAQNSFKIFLFDPCAGSMSFNLHIFRDFPAVFLLFISGLISLWPESRHFMIPLVFVMVCFMWSLSWWASHVSLGKKCWFSFVGWRCKLYYIDW